MQRLRSLASKVTKSWTGDEPLQNRHGLDVKAFWLAHQKERDGTVLTPHNINLLKHPNFNKHVAAYEKKMQLNDAMRHPGRQVLTREKLEEKLKDAERRRRSVLIDRKMPGFMWDRKKNTVIARKKKLDAFHPAVISITPDIMRWNQEDAAARRQAILNARKVPGKTWNKKMYDYRAKMDPKQKAKMKTGFAWNVPSSSSPLPTILQRSNSARNFYGSGMEKAPSIAIARRMKNAEAQHGNGSLALEGLPFNKMIQGVRKYKDVYGPREVLTREKLETKLKDAETRRQAVLNSRKGTGKAWDSKRENIARRKALGGHHNTANSLRLKQKDAERRREAVVNSRRVPNRLKSSVQKRDAIHAQIPEKVKEKRQNNMAKWWMRKRMNPRSGIRTKPFINQWEHTQRNRAVALATS